MHKSSMLRMQWFVDNYASKITKNNLKVLDVGSYGVNGTYRSLFNDSKYHYVGLDMENGPNVDIVLENPYDWDTIETDSFDIVISGQAFEHIEFFWKTMEEMTRVLKEDGLLCIIAPQGFKEHRFPVDCYRFFSDGMISLARYVGLEPLHAHTNSAPSTYDADWYSEHADSMLIAKKYFSGLPKHPDFKTYQCIPPNQEIFRTGLIPFQKIHIQQALKKAVKHHKSNQLQEAEKIYKSILYEIPNHPDANHNLGVLMLQTNTLRVALHHFEKALKSNPKHPEYKNSLRNVKEKLKKKLDVEKYQHSVKETSKLEMIKEPKRTDILNFLLSKISGKTKYLEIGVRNPNDNYNQIVASEKYSVDPGIEYEKNPVDFKITSDKFFEELSNDKILSSDIQFDVIFIDGLHLAEQVDKDIANSMKFIKKDGFIVLHDCNPPTIAHARENMHDYNTLENNFWNGTTWKAFLKWRFNPSVNSCCIDTDWGVGILSKGKLIGSSISESNQFFEFNIFDANRKHFLNLTSFEEFKKFL